MNEIEFKILNLQSRINEKKHEAKIETMFQVLSQLHKCK